DFGGQLQCAGRLANSFDNEDVGYQHATRNPAQQACAECNDTGVAVYQLQHQSTAPNNNGHTNDQAENDQANLMIRICALRCAGNGNDIVQAHDKVGHNNGFDSSQHRCAAPDVAMLVLFRQQKLDAYPDQQQGA